MSPSKLILVKHSQPAIDPHIDARDWHLSEAGRARCQFLVEQLRSYLPAALYSSDEPKAMETAQLIGEPLGLRSIARPNLHEHDRRGTPYEVNPADFEASVAMFFARPDERVYGNESAQQALARFSKAIAHILDQGAAQSATPIVITHGTVITLFVAAHNGMDSAAAFAFWKSLKLPSVVELSLPDFKLLAKPISP